MVCGRWDRARPLPHLDGPIKANIPLFGPIGVWAFRCEPCRAFFWAPVYTIRQPGPRNGSAHAPGPSGGHPTAPGDAATPGPRAGPGPRRAPGAPGRHHPRRPHGRAMSRDVGQRRGRPASPCAGNAIRRTLDASPGPRAAPVPPAPAGPPNQSQSTGVAPAPAGRPAARASAVLDVPVGKQNRLTCRLQHLTHRLPDRQAWPAAAV